MRLLKRITEAIRNAVATQLSMSDAVQTGDLLRFYTPDGLKPLDSSKISYTETDGSTEKSIKAER